MDIGDLFQIKSTFQSDRIVITATQIDEVVGVGYVSVLKKNLTTAIAQVISVYISQAGVSHVMQLLMGRAAGLQATVNSMQPDGRVNISIRGGGNPIYVIDGIDVYVRRYLLLDKEEDLELDEPEAYIFKETSTDGEDFIYEPVEDEQEYNRIFFLLQDEDSEYEVKITE